MIEVPVFKQKCHTTAKKTDPPKYSMYQYRIDGGSLRLLLIYLFPEKAGSCTSKATPELLSAVMRNIILVQCVLSLCSQSKHGCLRPRNVLHISREIRYLKNLSTGRPFQSVLISILMFISLHPLGMIFFSVIKYAQFFKLQD